MTVSQSNPNGLEALIAYLKESQVSVRLSVGRFSMEKKSRVQLPVRKLVFGGVTWSSLSLEENSA